MIRENAGLIHPYGAYVDQFNEGKIDPFLEDSAAAGCDIIETLVPSPLGDVDPSSAKERVGAQVCLKGHIDQVNLIRRGTPEQVRCAVRKANAVAGPSDGFATTRNPDGELHGIL